MTSMAAETSPQFDRPNALEAESSFEVLRNNAEMVIARANRSIEEKFSKGSTTEDGESTEEWSEADRLRLELPFHNKEHTEGVKRRTDIIMDAFRQVGLVNDRDAILADLAAAAHDVVQRWDTHVVDGKEMRHRFQGENEKETVAWALQQMDDVGGFSEEDRKKVEEAILATDAPFDLEMGTCVQKFLSKETSPVAFAVAFADLGEAGMDPDAYLKGGTTLFREANMDMLTVDLRRQEDESEEDHADRTESYRERMLGWIKFQPSFAMGRKLVTEKEIAMLPEAAQESVGNILTEKFEETIDRSIQRAKEWETMDVVSMYKEMGYSL